MSELSPREKRSKAMFATKDAIDIYGAVSGFSIDPPAMFSAQDVQQEFFDSSTVNIGSVRRHMAKLQSLGAVTQVPGEDRPILYQRQEDPFWNFVSALVSDEIDRSLES